MYVYSEEKVERLGAIPLQTISPGKLYVLVEEGGWHCAHAQLAS